MLRIKFGFRSLLRHMLMRWKEYQNLCRMISSFFSWYRSNVVPECFLEWKTMARKAVFHRKDLLNRWGRRLRNNLCAGCFLQWVLFIQKKKKTLLFVRRLLHNPHFLIWVQYTKFSKHVKFLSKHATTIQAAVRRFLRRWFFLRVRRAVVRLDHFAESLLAIREKRRRRARVVEEGFRTWLPEELASQEKRSNDVERRRHVVQQQLMQEKEAHLVLDLKRHMKSRSGVIQLKELAGQLRREGIQNEAGEVIKKLSKKESVELAKKDLLRQCSDISRLMGKHDFLAKSPPAYVCADNNCRAICSTIAQYQSHLRHSEHHKKHPIDYCNFHFSMKNVKFQEALRQHLITMFGVDVMVNCLDLYLSIQDWRRVTISTESFVHKAVYIFDTFLKKDCSRPVPIDFWGMPQVVEEFVKLEFVKYRDYEGFYSLKHRSPGIFRRMFGLKGKSYEAWTTENLVYSNAFDEVEWQAFLYLFQHVEKTGFYESETGKQYESEIIAYEKDREATLKKLYEEARLRDILLWSKAFIVQEKRISALALHAANTVLAIEGNSILDEALFEGSCWKTFDVQHDQQKTHEFTKLLAEDTSFSTMEDIVEHLYESYASAVVAGMWEDPDGRKSMLEFAGYLKKKPKSRLLIKMDARNESHEWFKKLMDDTIEEEKATIPLDTVSAAKRIQRRVRGIVGRNQMRKLFASIYSKAYDPTSGAYYYINNVNGDTMWERPSFMNYLFPQSKW